MDILKVIYKALDDKFAKDIVILDISQLSVMADYFIIAEGNNPNQVQAMADEIKEKLAVNFSLKPIAVEGYQEAKWILLHFGDFVLHLFNKEEREFYRLEKVWGDAKTVTLDN